MTLAYGMSRKFLEQSGRDYDLISLVRQATLHLYDLDLIVLFRASRDNGYNVTWDSLKSTMTRDEVEAEFDRDRDENFVDDEADLVFFIQTPRGEEVYRGLPPDATPRA